MSSSSKENKGRRPPSRDSLRPTVVPPVAPEEIAQQPAARRTPGGLARVRESQATLTDEVALELARQESMAMTTPLPRVNTPAPPRANDPSSWADDMRDRFSLGDFTGALDVAERILGSDAARAAHGEASKVSAECREQLMGLYEAKLGSVDRVPVVVMAREDLKALSIDHRAGFLLSHIDGVSSLETILDVSGMPRLDALRILVELVQKRVIALR